MRASARAWWARVALVAAGCALGPVAVPALSPAQVRELPEAGGGAATREGEGIAGESALLRPARPDAIEFAAGEFTMGATEGERDRGVNLCAREPGALDTLQTHVCLGLPVPLTPALQQARLRNGESPAPSLCDKSTFFFEYESRDRQAPDAGGPHRVVLRAFALDRTEVTVARYAQCVRAGACAPSSVAPGAPLLGGPSQPVVGITWDDAVSFCTWAGGRLPTEAEWERAARGTRGTPFPWGYYADPMRANAGSVNPARRAPGLHRAGCTENADGYTLTAPVGSFPAGATPDGLLDMAGNVWEWVSDFWDDERSRYPSPTAPAQIDPRGPSRGAEHAMRGGSYAHPAFMLRTTYRGHAPGGVRSLSTGARCAYDR